jgi:pimeloyl-ACP methyl ester carboxylesterase
MTRQLAACIPGARSVVLAEQRHMMPVEAPREVNKMLLDFLTQARTLTESAKGIVA